MTLTSAALEVLVAKGLSAADILDVARALEVRKDPTAAERKRRQREREAAGRDMSQRDVTRDEPPSLDKEKCPKEINPTPAHTHTSPARVAPWPCPEGVDARHWSDFLANRKRKKLTNSVTAHEGVLADIARLSDDHWPPGALVQHAAAKGWGSINYPSDGPRDERRNGQQRMAGHRSGGSVTIDAARDFIADARGYAH